LLTRLLREHRRSVAGGLVVAGWCVGLLVFGSPADGGFRRAIPFGALPMVAFAAAVLVCEAVRGRARRAGQPVVARIWLLIWGFAVAGVTGSAFWGHVGGVCMDPDDACLIRWRMRVGLLAVWLGAIFSVWGVGAVARRSVRLQPGSQPA
jgi:hypothetical protein